MELFIGHPTYSSWSLRGWLMVERFGLPCTMVPADLYQGGKARDLAPVAPATTVPVLRLDDGTLIGDSLAIAETLHELFPDAGLWPADPAARARARWLAAEMHSGFSALRGACPMVLSHRLTDFAPSEAVLADLARLSLIWAAARDVRTGDGPWLCGSYSVADAFFAPVAMRVLGYGLPLPQADMDYVRAHGQDPAITRWRDMGAADPLTPPPYHVPGTEAPWPL